MLESLIARNSDLTAAQACLRALIVFAVCLVLIRLSGRRSFGQRSPFDQVVAILLGAMLGRTVIGASPMIPTVAGAITIVSLHRLLAKIALRFPRFDAALNGRELIVARGGSVVPEELHRGLLSERDLAESARAHGEPDWRQYELLVLERTGTISAIGKSGCGAGTLAAAAGTPSDRRC